LFIVIDIVIIIFLGDLFGPRGKGAYVKHQPVKQGQTTTPGTTCHTLFDKCVGSLFNVPCQPSNTEDARGGAYGL